jgi:ribosomal protein L7Ae-like RNA K-turn-binding protein
MELIRKQKAGVVFLARDISADIGEKVALLADRFGVPHVAIFDKERLGAFLGKGLRSVAAIERSGFIDTVTREIVKYRNFFEGGMDAR